MIVESANPCTRSPTAAHARGARSARARRRDRRRADRDRAPGRLRAAGAVAVREVGGDVLHPRVPEERLPAARADPRAAARDRPAAGAGDPRRLVRGDGRARRRRARAPLRDGRGAVTRGVRRRLLRACSAEQPELAGICAGDPLRDARADAAGRRGRRGRALGRTPTTCAQSYPESVRRAGFEGEGLALGEALFERDPRAPLGRRVHRRRVRGDLARLATPGQAASG